MLKANVSMLTCMEHAGDSPIVFSEHRKQLVSIGTFANYPQSEGRR